MVTFPAILEIRAVRGKERYEIFEITNADTSVSAGLQMVLKLPHRHKVYIFSKIPNFNRGSNEEVLIL